MLQRPSAIWVKDLPLTSGQIGWIRAPPVAADHLVEGRAGEVGTEERLAGIDGFNGLHEFVRGRLLKNVAVGARPDAAQHEFSVGVRGQHQHFDIWQFLAQGFGHGQAGQVRHVHVGHEDVRHEISGLAQSFLAVGGFADDLQVWVSFQAGHDAPAHDGVVVGKQ